MLTSEFKSPYQEEEAREDEEKYRVKRKKVWAQYDEEEYVDEGESDEGDYDEGDYDEGDNDEEDYDHESKPCQCMRCELHFKSQLDKAIKEENLVEMEYLWKTKDKFKGKIIPEATLLEYGITKGSIFVVESELEEYSDPKKHINTRVGSAPSLFMRTISQGHLPLIHLFMAKAFMPLHVEGGEETLAHYAAACDYPDITKVLIEALINQDVFFDMFKSTHESPMEIATRLKKRSMVEMMFPYWVRQFNEFPLYSKKNKLFNSDLRAKLWVDIATAYILMEKIDTLFNALDTMAGSDLKQSSRRITWYALCRMKTNRTTVEIFFNYFIQYMTETDMFAELLAFQVTPERNIALEHLRAIINDHKVKLKRQISKHVISFKKTEQYLKEDLRLLRPTPGNEAFYEALRQKSYSIGNVFQEEIMGLQSQETSRELLKQCEAFKETMLQRMQEYEATKGIFDKEEKRLKSLVKEAFHNKLTEVEKKLTSTNDDLLLKVNAILSKKFVAREESAVQILESQRSLLRMSKHNFISACDKWKGKLESIKRTWSWDESAALSLETAIKALQGAYDAFVEKEQEEDEKQLKKSELWVLENRIQKNYNNIHKEVTQTQRKLRAYVKHIQNTLIEDADARDHWEEALSKAIEIFEKNSRMADKAYTHTDRVMVAQKLDNIYSQIAVQQQEIKKRLNKQEAKERVIIAQRRAIEEAMMSLQIQEVPAVVKEIENERDKKSSQNALVLEVMRESMRNNSDSPFDIDANSDVSEASRTVTLSVCSTDSDFTRASASSTRSDSAMSTAPSEGDDSPIHSERSDSLLVTFRGRSTSPANSRAVLFRPLPPSCPMKLLAMCKPELANIKNILPYLDSLECDDMSKLDAGLFSVVTLFQAMMRAAHQQKTLPPSKEKRIRNIVYHSPWESVIKVQFSNRFHEIYDLIKALSAATGSKEKWQNAVQKLYNIIPAGIKTAKSIEENEYNKFCIKLSIEIERRIKWLRTTILTKQSQRRDGIAPEENIMSQFQIACCLAKIHALMNDMLEICKKATTPAPHIHYEETLKCFERELNVPCHELLSYNLSDIRHQGAEYFLKVVKEVMNMLYTRVYPNGFSLQILHQMLQQRFQSIAPLPISSVPQGGLIEDQSSISPLFYQEFPLTNSGSFLPGFYATRLCPVGTNKFERAIKRESGCSLLIILHSALNIAPLPSSQ